MLPEEDFQLLDPSSLWHVWDFLQTHTYTSVLPNPPSSGFMGELYRDWEIDQLTGTFRSLNFLILSFYIREIICHYHAVRRGRERLSIRQTIFKEIAIKCYQGDDTEMVGASTITSLKGSGNDA